MPDLGSAERPLRVAVVGSGPSGFYAAQHLLNADVEVEVEMFDRLPTPFGLVRYGVAPDHPKIKNVIKVYEKTASDERFSFFGNVAVATDISMVELQTYYDAVIVACGAQTDRRLGIPGEDLPGSYTAIEFVAWYNGHPEYQDRTFDLSGEVAVVIGQGNVAMDVSRILCKSVDELKATDITRNALDALAESKVEEVHMIGRRGPVQAAFTPAEIKEFGDLPDCDPVVDAADLSDLGPTSEAELSDSQRRKNLEVLQEFSTRGAPRKSRRFVVHFLKSPQQLLGSDRVEGVVLGRNELTGEAGAQKVRATGESEELACGAFFRSVGYRGVRLEGVPFDDDRGTIPNRSGRITDGDQFVEGLYAVGWIKRGPTGIIGTNKADSLETVKSLLADVAQLSPCQEPHREALLSLLASRGVQVVSYDDWLRIDAAEVARGVEVQKPREKLTDCREMLVIAGDGSDRATVS